jgi:hypothetical protein
MKRFFFIVLVFAFFISCHDTSPKHLFSVDYRSSWLLKNEDDLNKELNKRIILKINDIPKNAVFNSATIVITKNDSTILGEFAKLFSDYNPCLLISYTFSGDTTKRKVISIVRDPSMNCIVNTDTILPIDSTKYFIIKKISK